MTWHTAITALLLLGTILRLTRLVTDDTITKPLRNLVERLAHTTHRNLPNGTIAPHRPHPAWHWLDQLINCPWCTSPWLGFALLATHHYIPHGWAWTAFLAAMTASHITGTASAWLDSPPPKQEHHVTLNKIN